MPNSLDFFYKYFGQHLPGVGRDGDKMFGLPTTWRRVTPIQRGFCMVTQEEDAEVFSAFRGTGGADGKVTIDWRLAGVFPAYVTPDKTKKRLSTDGVVVLITSNGVWMTNSIEGVPFKQNVPRSEIYKILLQGDVSCPHMLVYFCKNGLNVVSNLRLTYTRDLVDMGGNRSGIVRLDLIRNVLDSNIPRTDVNKWKKKGEPAALSGLLSPWSEHDFEIYNSATK